MKKKLVLAIIVIIMMVIVATVVAFMCASATVSTRVIITSAMAAFCIEMAVMAMVYFIYGAFKEHDGVLHGVNIFAVMMFTFLCCPCVAQLYYSSLEGIKVPASEVTPLHCHAFRNIKMHGTYNGHTVVLNYREYDSNLMFLYGIMRAKDDTVTVYQCNEDVESIMCHLAF